jgi:hypothetical protein
MSSGAAHIFVRVFVKGLRLLERENSGGFFTNVLKKNLKFGPFTAEVVDAALFRANLIGIGTRSLFHSQC